MRILSREKNKSYLLLASFLGLISIQTYAATDHSIIAHPPYRIKPNVTTFAPSGLTPSQVKNAYGFSAVSFQGEGQTIAIVDAYDDPNIEADLGVFSSAFNLPACTTANGCFTKVYASGSKPNTDAGWSGEISLDVEWVHAIAPKAKIILVEAASASMDDLMQGVQVAIKTKASTISMSWGGTESSDQTSYDSTFNVSGVTFTAAAGDNGHGVIYPASSPYVLSVGGTSLSTNAAGNYLGETAWDGSGGGLSQYETIPTYQSNYPIPHDVRQKRGVPDVSYNADPNTGVAVYNSVGLSGKSGWFVVGGTSAGAPQWAALIAIANSAASKNLDGVNGLLYGTVAANFNDVTSGNNGKCNYFCSARVGYDYITGVGSPRAQTLITDLAKQLSKN